jgi:hypothetical protein
MAPLVDADRIDDIASLSELRKEERNLLGLVLEVGVHQHGVVPLSALEPRGDCGVLSEIPTEPESDDLRIGLAQRPDPVPGSVRASVVDEKHLERSTICSERGNEARDEFVEIRLAPIDGDDNRNASALRHR